MIFAGDVAIANQNAFKFIGFESLQNKPWCLNLEGAVLVGGVAAPQWGTYNSIDWLQSFTGFRLAPIFLANNHIHDLVGGVAITHNYLTAQGVEWFGAGTNIDAAATPVSFTTGSATYTLLGFGWPVIGCRPAGKISSGVNRLEGRRVLAQVKAEVKAGSGSKVVVVIHGNYEFEKYPQPAHRKLARQLIDEGVYAVICHHPHIVSPVERYRGRTIAYSLGNWAFSYGHFFGGKLKFPESSYHQIAVELAEEGDKVHHAKFEPQNTVRYVRTESVDAPDFSLKPAFEGFDDSEYLQWFRKNRHKRKGLPIYRDAEDSFSNSLRDVWVALRQRLIDKAAMLGLKKMRRS